MSVHDKAADGTLTLTELQAYLDKNLPLINQIGGNSQLTLLGAACLGGRLELVKLLLNKEADPNVPSSYERTPLFFATDPECKASPSVRRAIVHALILKNANVDGPCDDDKNTPLMNVILQLKDKDIIHELIDGGASTTVKWTDQQKTAKQLADDNGLSRELLTKAERESGWKKLIDTVVAFVLLIIAWANNQSVNRIVGGIANVYNIRVNEADVPKDLQDKVQLQTIGEFKNFLNEEVKSGKFEKFFSPNDPFLQTLAVKANALKDDPTTDLGNPENIKRLTQVSLYRPVIYCDDSGSMKKENRYESQVELVSRIVRIATLLLPKDDADVDLRFINNSFSSRLPADKIKEAMEKVEPRGGTNIGTSLREKILKPFVYDVISKATAAAPIPFSRPLLVCVITDGSPGPETPNVFRDEIVECKKKLEAKGYDPTSVMFCINQIGTSEDATEFLEGLRQEKDIENVIYCTVDQLDVKFKELRENERALESWLLHLLAKSVVERNLD